MSHMRNDRPGEPGTRPKAPPGARDETPSPEQESLKRHGDDLQDLVDKATEPPRASR